MWARIALGLMIGLLGGGTAPSETMAQSPAQMKPVKEYQLKAVFLFNFTQFVEWPSAAFPDQGSPLNICVLGDDPFGAYLDETVRGERVNNRPILVQRYHKLSEVKSCHILFISRSESDRVEPILDDLHGKNILTVSDVDGFSTHGGMIRLVTDKNKIRLSINVDAAKAADMTISSKLLRSAEIVTAKKE